MLYLTQAKTPKQVADQIYRLTEISTPGDIFPEYRHTPIGLLLEYHNLKKPFERYERAQILVGMCMDNRKHLHIPGNFAYIIRSGGANLRFSELRFPML